ncbi:MAG: type II secretion system protein [Sedimentisphaerales bacterium]|nr:type II secretion system protein [Sedimentisphaerales bacterium]
MKKSRIKAFTLIELLVVITIISLLVSILLPALSRARRQATITTVNAELYQIGLALETYMLENSGNPPPTYASCMIQDHFFQLPDELAEGGYLPERPHKHGAMSTGIEDRFNPDHTYKYQAPGPIILNGGTHVKNGSSLHIPDGFPDNQQATGHFYSDPKESPVSWVIYSLGPHFDLPMMKSMFYPLPSTTWYDPVLDYGVLTRIRLKNGQHVGAFERS